MPVPESSRSAHHSANELSLRTAFAQTSPDDLSETMPSQRLSEQFGIDRRCWQTSHVCFAAIAPLTFTLQEGNPRFHQWFHSDRDRPNHWLAHWSAESQAHLRRLYQQHLLYRIFQTRWPSLPHLPSLHSSVTLTSEPTMGQPFQAIECWLSSEHLSIAEPLASTPVPSPDWLNLSAEQVTEVLEDPEAIADLYSQVSWERYVITGNLWLEGVDVTQREQRVALNHALMHPQQLIHPDEQAAFHQQLRAVVNADQLLLCGVYQHHLRPLRSPHHSVSVLPTVPLEHLTNTAVGRAIQTYELQYLADLETEVETAFCQYLHQAGGRSLLVLPLTHHTTDAGDRQAIAGVAVFLSEVPHGFHYHHRTQTQQLVPVLKTALNLALQAMQQQRLIRNIHPAVERHFQREAERRSWGLPPEPIILKELYPLYGISDIRGSSTERNRAIQVDLLEQFQRARQVIQTATQCQPNAFCRHLETELDTRIAQLRQGVTVDAEFAALDYLRQHVELYFEHFRQLGEAPAAAVAAYWQACDRDQGTVYRARAAYDRTLLHINHQLRQVWEECQVDMQQITPHYCDMEATDGIDHMIYAGQAIDPKFSLFHLRSLRYEQLRAVCRCARHMFALKPTLEIPLDVAHLVLVQDTQIDIFHDEKTERLFDVKGTKDTRYEIVKKRIDKGVDQRSHQRITQPGMLTIVYSLDTEWDEYHQYLRYLQKEGWVDDVIETGNVEPLQGVTGLRFARVRVCPEGADTPD